MGLRKGERGTFYVLTVSQGLVPKAPPPWSHPEKLQPEMVAFSCQLFAVLCASQESVYHILCWFVHISVEVWYPMLSCKLSETRVCLLSIFVSLSVMCSQRAFAGQNHVLLFPLTLRRSVFFSATMPSFHSGSRIIYWIVLRGTWVSAWHWCGRGKEVSAGPLREKA